MSILITGGTGFLGERVLKALENRNEKVIIVSRKSDSTDERILQCDLSKESLSVDQLRDVTTIFHLAAYTHDLSNPKGSETLYQSLNIDATVNLAESAILAGVQRFFFISSVKAGEANIDDDLKTIDDNHLPQGIYGKTKRKAECKLLEMTNNTCMNLTILRSSLIYGPKAKGNLSLMLKGIEKGWFPTPPQVNNRRSMIHVDDLVSAILFLEKNENSFGEIYIATDGKYYSIRDIYNTLCEVSGRRQSRLKLPLILIKILSRFNSNLDYKFQKLIGNEYYSSKKLKSLGFEAKFRLNQINEKIF